MKKIIAMCIVLIFLMSCSTFQEDRKMQELEKKIDNLSSQLDDLSAILESGNQQATDDIDKINNAFDELNSNLATFNKLIIEMILLVNESKTEE